MDVERIKEDFPVLRKRNIIYFDNACTTLKPQQVIDAVVEYYENYSSCAGRSVHRLAKETEERFEEARNKVAKFVGAKREEIVFTKNTTEAINLIAHSLEFKKGDKVVTTILEHHSALLPFQLLVKKGLLTLEFVYPNDEAEFELEKWEEKIDKSTKLIVIHHTSNVFGTTPPLKDIIKLAHDFGALVLLDAAQGVPHYEVNVKKLGCDFLAFSSHKMLGPTGVGCLYARYELLEELNPFILGGDTIKEVKPDRFILDKPPYKFEAGIQNYAGIIGLGAAVDYLKKIGMKNVEKYEKELAKYLLENLLSIENVKIYGPLSHEKRCALVTFNLLEANPHEVAIMLDKVANIAVRSGMFCAQPALEYFGAMSGAVRASLYIYNTKEEIDVFIKQLKKIREVMR